MKVSITREKAVKINGSIVGKIYGQRHTNKGSYSGNSFGIELNCGKLIRLDFPYYSCVKDYIKTNAVELGLTK